MNTTCPNSHCNYKQADLHETSTHVIIYCQNCGYSEEHERKNANTRPAPAHKPKILVLDDAAKRKRKKSKGVQNITPMKRAS